MEEMRIRDEVFQKVKQLYSLRKKNDFVPGETYIQYGGTIYDEKEICRLVDSALEMRLAAGRFARQLEKKFAAFLGVKYCSLTNSGSSANLLALSALTSPKLGDARLKPGAEVISVAAGFPTTVGPIIQNRLIPVFVDVELGTYNIQVEKLEAAVSEKTGAIFLAHTLGNPFNLKKVQEFTEEYGLWLIEDNCDALGSKYEGRYTGSFGQLATSSFYPPHHMTMGEGGAVFTNELRLKRLVESFRDWGRDCWCQPGTDNSCGKRFELQLGKLPSGYDHKYTYSHIGYNLKLTEMQAAVGLEQLKKLPAFIEARKRNFNRLYAGLKKYKAYFILPKVEAEAEPSWFAFLLTVRENAGFTRNELVRYLEKHKIATRMLFAGNLTKHPCFEGVDYRICGGLKNTDLILENSFFIGVYPGINKAMTDYIIETFDRFFQEKLPQAELVLA
ncbi:MAG: lipopolysaccharide biosynthesis protein RfbH [Methanosarcinaceae archaeon]|nr:lipopolysaccharide biosynthesis protein RfbH [Methanosarcinaceae archaeon]